MRLRRAPTQYKPVSRIAVGGMAEVWRGTATFEGGDEYPVAIKRVLPHITDPLFRAMFKDEARLGMTLRHPNIVPVYDARDKGCQQRGIETDHGQRGVEEMMATDGHRDHHHDCGRYRDQQRR